MEFASPRNSFDPARVAYIKPTPWLEASRQGLIPPGINLPSDVKLYVLHLGDGTVIGVTDDWNSAYSAAVQNDLTPVSLH